MSTTPGLPGLRPSGRPARNAAGGLSAEAAPGLTQWLLREGRFLPDNGVLLSQFCERVVAAGIALDRAALHLRAFHARYRGVSRIWRPGEPLDERYLDHGIEKTATYLESPVRAVAEDHTRREWRLDEGGALPYPVLEELRGQGFTHYVMVPLVYGQRVLLGDKAAGRLRRG